MTDDTQQAPDTADRSDTPDTKDSRDSNCASANCNETLRELDLFLDDELSRAARTTIRQHLDGCPDCLGAFDFHAELKQVVSAKCQNDEMPPDLLSRIEQCFDTDFDGDGVIG
jgi:mycothiol system anti-sigma-R factor